MTGIIIQNSPVLNTQGDQSIDTNTLVATQTVVFVNTGMKPAVLRLSNGGTVGGDSDYVLMPGNVTFQFDGTNLV
jgi:hypothetical protein